MTAGGLLVPRVVGAGSSSTSERKFLFVFCRGGWDTAQVFTPLDHIPEASPSDGTVAEVEGISFVDAESRPSVRDLFEGWGDRTCVINGVEVRSVTHERCRRIVLTGSSEGAADDWPTLLAAHSGQPLLMPHLVLSGPAFSASHTSKVVRIGAEGQLSDLLDGQAFATSNTPLVLPDPELEALEDAFVRARIDSQLGGALDPRGSTFRSHYATALDQADELATYEDLDLAPGTLDGRRDVVADARTALDVFEQGLSRCALVRHDGHLATGWDTHDQNQNQAQHFEQLFSMLVQTLEDLDSRPSLADQVTIVVFSEMGRHPVMNTRGGKDHWTYTSAMLIGAGVRGGQVIGGLDEGGVGSPIDLASGEVTEGGTYPLAKHLGATLLAIGDVDPTAYTDAEPIEAALG